MESNAGTPLTAEELDHLRQIAVHRPHFGPEDEEPVVTIDVYPKRCLVCRDIVVKLGVEPYGRSS